MVATMALRLRLQSGSNPPCLFSFLTSSTSVSCASLCCTSLTQTHNNNRNFHSTLPLNAINLACSTLASRIVNSSSSSISSSSSLSPSFPSYQTSCTSSSSSSSLVSVCALFSEFRRSVHNPLWMRGRGPHPKNFPRKTPDSRLARRIFAVRAWQRLNPLERLPILPQSGQTIIHHRPPPLESWVYKFSDGSMTPMGIVELNSKVFGETIRKDIVQRVVHWQRRKAMRGTASSKGRGEVNGSRKKMWPQKGTGRARHGDRKAPHMIGGGVAHGPKPHSYEIGMPRKIRLRSTRICLSAKYQESRLFVIDKAELPSHRSLPLSIMMQKFGLKYEATLIIWNDKEEGFDPNLGLAVRTQPLIDVIPSRGINSWTMLRHRTILITLSALKDIETRYHPSFRSDKRIRFMVGSSGGGISPDEFRKIYAEKREQRLLKERIHGMRNLFENPPLHFLYTLKQLSNRWSNLGKEPQQLEKQMKNELEAAPRQQQHKPHKQQDMKLLLQSAISREAVNDMQQ